MARSAARYYRGVPCCGGAPVWNDPYSPSNNGQLWGGIYGVYGGPLSADEVAAIEAIESYGGTFIPGRPPMLKSQTRYDYQNGAVAEMDAGVPDSYGAPYDRNVPRITSAQQVPSLPNPDAGPQNGLPHADATRSYLARERVRATPTPWIRAVWDEVSGHHLAQILWCDSCGPDEWQLTGENLASLGESIVPVVRGIAMVCSYIPVFGTAVSFVLSTAMNLAEGMKLTDSVLTAIGESLPGQPVSGMAFNAAVSIIEGDSINAVAVNALPDPPTTPVLKQSLIAASDIMIDVANGKTIAEASLDELERQLPPRAAQVVNIARRLANGEPVATVAYDVIGKEAADAMAHAATLASQAGGGAASRFVSEAGFQALMEGLPDEIRDGFKAGFTVAIAKKMQEQQDSLGFTTKETNVPANDTYAAQGQQLVNEGAKFGTSSLLDLLKKPTFSITIQAFSGLTNSYQPIPMVYTIDADWKRGFMIAMGVCNGSTAPGPGQAKVRASLGTQHAQQGFDAGQAVQFWRTVNETHYAPVQSSAVSRAASAVLKPTSSKTPAKAPTPVIAPPRTAPVVMAPDVYAQKTADRKKWVDYYKRLV